MRQETQPVGGAQLVVASGRFAQVLRSGVLPVFVGSCAVEAALILLLPAPSAELARAVVTEQGWTLLSGPVEVGFLGLAVLLLSLIELVRVSLYAPMRRIALDDVQLTAKEALSDAVRRMLPVFLVKQLVGLLVLGASLLFLLFGVQMATIPYAVVTFIFAPALYLVAAHDRALLTAMRDSVRIARENLFAVFGVQGALLVLAVWLGQLIQHVGSFAAQAPFAAAWGLVGVVLTYRFAHFYAMSTLFLALDENGHCASTA